jgi:hypothetical protein
MVASLILSDYLGSVKRPQIAPSSYRIQSLHSTKIEVDKVGLADSASFFSLFSSGTEQVIAIIDRDHDPLPDLTWPLSHQERSTTTLMDLVYA